MPDFFIVDVFTQGPFTGNPLAVFVHGERFETNHMQSLARELNFSETTFILPRNADGSWPVRIFTPVAELPFAGHPTLGTAFVIANKLMEEPTEVLTLDLLVGRIEIQIKYEHGKIHSLVMRQPQPIFSIVYPTRPVWDALGLARYEIPADLPPVQLVSTGLPFLIVPVPSLQAVREARLTLDRFETIPDMDPSTNVLLYTTEAQEASHDLHVRVFVPELGISEDPATGSANGCLCAYLLRYGQNGTAATSINLHAIVEQGYEIGRPSLLYLSGARKDETYEIHVGGQVEWVAQSTLYDSKDEDHS